MARQRAARRSSILDPPSSQIKSGRLALFLGGIAQQVASLFKPEHSQSFEVLEIIAQGVRRVEIGSGAAQLDHGPIQFGFGECAHPKDSLGQFLSIHNDFFT